MKRGTSAVIAVALVMSVQSLGAIGASAAGSRRPKARAGRALCRGALTLPTHSNHVLIDTAITCLIDRERIHYRLPPLRPNHDLQGIASSLATEMVISGYFSDDSLAGQTPWQRITASPYATGARILSAAQNIGWGTGGLATPEGMVSAWMYSAPHRAIILTSGYRDIGAGVAPLAPSSLTDEKPGATYTVELAARG